MTTAAIIDDDEDVVQVFTEYLQLCGVNVVSVGHNGMHAVEIYKNHKPDIMFIDIAMPEYDGIYCLGEIRKIDSGAAIVMMTEYLDRHTEERLDGLNPTDILMKPFDVIRVRGIIEKSVPSGRGFATQNVKKALISFTVTEALLELSPSAASEVGDRLYARHGCYFSDCLEHPEYLREVLYEIFGAASSSITKAIERKLDDFNEQREISDFISVLVK